METDNLKMWTCGKYEFSVLETNAKAFCAKQFARTQDPEDIGARAGCASCKRGAMYYELGLHKEPTRGHCDAETRRSETKQAKPETNRQKGDTTVATNAKGTCTTAGCERTVQKEGLCYKCFKAKHGHAPYGAEAKKTTKTTVKKSKALSPRPPVASLSPCPTVAGGGNSSGALQINIDLARFPRLHSRLITAGIDAMFAELETKA